ncbi:MAG: Rid family detoxifying hydrolase [Flavobacteriaceae bacterium]|nr:Rid family detoxifying hydrolase [Flavobacteriaceae bacterium]
MKKIIYTKDAPSPIGAYSQAVLVDNVLYTSGQIAINPVTNLLVLDDIKKETKQVMENLKAILKAANMTFENVFKSTIFLSDMHNFTQVNEVYGSYLDKGTAPARETVQVANLPKFVHIEISVIATK